MLNATLFTSALASIPLREGQPRFLRVKAILSATRGKSASSGAPPPPTRARSFFCRTTTLGDNLDVSDDGKESAGMACRGGHHLGGRRGRRGRLRGTVACPVSRRGIARDISSPPTLSLAERSRCSAPTNDHRRDR